MINDFTFDEQNYKKISDIWLQNTTINCADDVDKYLYNFRILFAYNSNKIENEHTTYNTTREIFEGENIKNFSGDLRTINELQNQKYCYDYLKDFIANKTKITKQLVLKIHKILMRYCYDDTRYITTKERPGKFKIKDYVVGADEIGSLPEYVEQDIDELLKEINESTADPNDHEKILKIGAYFHCTFETIHPFADG